MMLLSVAGYATLPVGVASGGVRGGSPLLFSLWLRLGMLVGVGAYLAVCHWRLVRDPDVWRRLVRGSLCWEMALTVASYLDVALFVLSASLVSVWVAMVLTQASTVVFVALMARLDRAGVYCRVGPGVLALLGLGLAGFGLVVFSERGWGSLSPGDWGGRALVGYLLAVGASFLGGLNACSFSLGRRLAGGVGDGSHAVDAVAVFHVVLCSWVANVAATALVGGAALVEARLVGPGPGFSLDAALVGLVWGGVFLSGAGILMRWSNVVTVSLGVNGLGYLRPAMSVGFLWVAGLLGLDGAGVRVARLDLFLLGTGVVVVANTLLGSWGGRWSGRGRRGVRRVLRGD